ncbi:MAG TPA: winged helix-turn-helix domain-containing protein [Blastocatellia bacterium]|nr:winged helix-turn-helix domain-containing protein [Blastocatellia bacterium]
MKVQQEMGKIAAPTNRSAGHFYEFANFRLDVADRLLTRDGEVVQLTPKALEILLILVGNHGRVLTKEELITAVWPASFVEEGNLARNISTLRQALGENNLIETVPRRGYRFTAGVQECWREAEAAAAETPGEPPRGLIRSMAVLPFQPLNAGECDGALGLRLADAVITRLSGLRKLIIRPTSAVRKYTNPEQDPVAVGSELKVEAVLSGSLQQSGKILRITTQLLSVQEGLSLWGAQFDTPFTDLFAVEDSLSGQMLNALTGQLIG